MGSAHGWDGMGIRREKLFIIVLPFDLGFESDVSQRCPLSVTPVTMLLSQHYSMRQWIGTLTNLLQAFAIRRCHI